MCCTCIYYFNTHPEQEEILDRASISPLSHHIKTSVPVIYHMFCSHGQETRAPCSWLHTWPCNVWQKYFPSWYIQASCRVSNNILRGAQIPGTKSSRWLNFVLWCQYLQVLSVPSVINIKWKSLGAMFGLNGQCARHFTATCKELINGIVQLLGQGPIVKKMISDTVRWKSMCAAVCRHWDPIYSALESNRLLLGQCLNY